MSTQPGSEVLSNGRNWTSTIRHDTYPFIDPSRLELSGKNVFITGASKGIGRSLALSYARAGASGIALGARSSLDAVSSAVASAAKEAGRPEPKVITVQLDVTDAKSVDTAVAKVAAAFANRLDTVVNNAGFLEPFIPIADSDPAMWWKTWEVNIKGPYLVARATLPLLAATPGGLKTLINVGSIGAHLIIDGGSAYLSTKLALLRLTEFTDAEYFERDGVVAFCVHPGDIPTELSSGLPPDWAKRVLIDKVELAADTTVWLSSQRREWLRARYVSCTWDMEEVLKRRKDIEDGDLLKVRMAVV